MRERGQDTICDDSPLWDGDKASQMDMGAIKALIILEELDPKELQKILNLKGVKTVEELDALTVRNLLRYLRTT